MGHAYRYAPFPTAEFAQALSHVQLAILDLFQYRLISARRFVTYLTAFFVMIPLHAQCARMDFLFLLAIIAATSNAWITIAFNVRAWIAV
jgi:hypothetical protein